MHLEFSCQLLVGLIDVVVLLKLDVELQLFGGHALSVAEVVHLSIVLFDIERALYFADDVQQVCFHHYRNDSDDLPAVLRYWQQRIHLLYS